MNDPTDPSKPKIHLKQIDPNEELQCGLTRTEIEKMKSAGIDKPSFIPWPEWLGPKKISQRQMFICYLAAMGRRPKEIAEQTGMTNARLSLLLNSEAIKDQIQLIREVEFAGLGVQQQLDQLTPQAVRIANRLMKSENTPDNLKWQVAQNVLDRKLGKPQQTVNVNNTLLTDIFQLMTDEAKASYQPNGGDALEVERGKGLMDQPANLLPGPINQPIEEATLTEAETINDLDAMPQHQLPAQSAEGGNTPPDAPASASDESPKEVPDEDNFDTGINKWLDEEGF